LGDRSPGELRTAIGVPTPEAMKTPRFHWDFFVMRRLSRLVRYQTSARLMWGTEHALSSEIFNVAFRHIRF
jgi:hypothetical protein